jgi:D-serine deaminase-like pyridoxal phosphate-dependent protein
MARVLASVFVDVRIASICFGNSLAMQSGLQKLLEYAAASAALQVLAAQIEQLEAAVAAVAGSGWCARVRVW